MPLLEEVDAEVDDVGQELLKALDLLQVLLEGLGDLVVVGQEQDHFLRLPQRLWVGHHLQELGSSEEITRNKYIKRNDVFIFLLKHIPLFS